MTGTAAGFCGNERRIVGRKRAGGSVESVYEQLVHSQIGHDGEAVVRRNVDRMRVSLGLEGRIPALADVFHERSLLAQRTVVFDPQDRNAAAAKICHQDIVAGLVDGEVTRAGPSGGQGVQQAQLAGCGIDGERAYVGRVVEVWAERERVLSG